MQGGIHTSETVQVACTEAQFDLLKRAAEQVGQSVEDWFRDQLVQIAGNDQPGIA